MPVKRQRGNHSRFGNVLSFRSYEVGEKSPEDLSLELEMTNVLETPEWLGKETKIGDDIQFTNNDVRKVVNPNFISYLLIHLKSYLINQSRRTWYNVNMLTASGIIQKYLSFFQSKQHIVIKGESLVPQNDPTTLFTSSGMQPLVPYLLGEIHPQGTRLVDVQNCFRAVDIEEIGDNRHTTFFRMLGNWSLGDYFREQEIPWLFEFLTKELLLDPKKLYVSVFEGYNDIPQDKDSAEIWQQLFTTAGINANDHISYYGVDKNWWSRSGPPDNMPAGEPGGFSTEVFYDFETPHNPAFGEKCHINCDCGRYAEIGNSVFMLYTKQADGSLLKLPKPNVDFGGGLERLLIASENQPDFFLTSLLKPVIASIESVTQLSYINNQKEMRIIADHFVSSIFIVSNNVKPANKEQGYILRRLLRRGLDNFYGLKGTDISPILETIVEQYKYTDSYLVEQYEEIKNTILEEEQKYRQTRHQAIEYIEKKYGKNEPHPFAFGNDPLLKGERKIHHDGTVKEISAEDAFILYTTHGLSPTQIKSMGYTFDDQAFAKKMGAHQKLSRKGGEQKFKGGLADHSEKTVMGHTATHLLHQALRDILGNEVHQTGSNITTERVRFDFNYDKKLTDEQIKQVEEIVNKKIKENLPVHFEIMPLEDAKKLGAIGLFMDTYGDKVKIYFIGPDSGSPFGSFVSSDSFVPSDKPYSIEFCGGPHVDFTGELKSFKIIKQENLGANMKRLYANVG